jgi:hypothetical protein
MEKPIELQKRRDVGEVISASFEFIRQNIKPLGKSLFFFAVPPAVVGGAAIGFATAKMMSNITRGGGTGSPSDIFSPTLLISYLISFLVLIATNLIISAVICAYLRLYFERKANASAEAVETPAEIEPQDVFQVMTTLFPKFIGLSLLQAVLLGFGLMLCILPGIWIGVSLGFVYFVLAYENRGIVESVQRCINLVSGQWWQTFAVALLMGLIGYFASMIFGIPSFVVSLVGTVLTASKNGGDMSIIQAAASGFQMIGSVISYSLVGIAGIVQYFNLIEQKEATGLMQRIDKIAGAE